MQATMIIGRFAGDPLVTRFGPRDVSRIGGVLTVLGLGLVMAVPSVPARPTRPQRFNGIGPRTPTEGCPICYLLRFRTRQTCSDGKRLAHSAVTVP
jgi:hypothetical protein